MINLLPPDYKKSLLFARRNLRLRKYVVASFGILLVLIGIILVGHMYIADTENAVKNDIQTTQGIVDSGERTKAQTDAEDMSASVKTTTLILGHQVMFSKLIQKLGNVFPPGAILLDIQLSKVEGAIDLHLRSKTYSQATQVQINLQDTKNALFEKADIISISCVPNDSSTATTKTSEYDSSKEYPCEINIRALFKQGASFLFQTSPTASGAKQ